jgi:hypothetical protein
MSSSLRTFQQINAEVLAHAKRLEEEAHVAYRVAPSKSIGYWAMIDLNSSALFRRTHGAQAAYKRAVVFSKLIDWLCCGYVEMEVFKELGDGVLVHSLDFRSIFELSVLVDGAIQYWNTESDRDPSYPSLDARVAVSFGECDQVGSDFLGTPIDVAARISGHRPGHSVVATVEGDVQFRNERLIEREYPFAKFSESQLLPGNLLKPREERIKYAELKIDRVVLRDFDDFFEGARRSVAGC